MQASTLPMRGELAFRRARLVRGDRERVASLLQGAHAFDRAGENAELIRVECDGHDPSLFVAHDIDDGRIAIEDRDRRHFTLSHLVGVR
jgi:hypothetical protein